MIPILHRCRALVTGLLGIVCLAAVAAPARAEEMKIGIVGSGRVGKALGELWIKAGHRVMFASRRPEQLRDMAAALGSKASTGTPQEAAAFGDVVLLAVPYGSTAQVGRDLAAIWRGKVVLDAGNAVAGRDGPEIAAEADRLGIGALSRDLLPGARVVRVFSSMNAAKFSALGFREPRIGMPVAGDDLEAVRTAERLVRDMGFEPVVVGNLERARLFQQREPFWRAAQEDLPAEELRQRLPPG
jgi:predicted dinucleotide-binding enzyme